MFKTRGTHIKLDDKDGDKDISTFVGFTTAVNSDKFRTANAIVYKTEIQVELTYVDKLTLWLSI